MWNKKEAKKSSLWMQYIRHFKKRSAEKKLNSRIEISLAGVILRHVRTLRLREKQGSRKEKKTTVLSPLPA